MRAFLLWTVFQGFRAHASQTPKKLGVECCLYLPFTSFGISLLRTWKFDVETIYMAMYIYIYMNYRHRSCIFNVL